MQDVSATALMTLQCHILDAQSKRSILCDRTSLDMRDYLRKQHGRVLKKYLPRALVTHIALRAKKYDDVVKRFLKKYPEASVINIGCGLDHRFGRIDNGKAHFYDLDFPEILDLKKTVFPPSERYHLIPSSVFDESWFAQVKPQNVLLIAEGVFMYCPEKEVKNLLIRLGSYFKEYEIFFEVFQKRWLSGLRRRVMERRLQQDLNFGKDARFVFGITDSHHLEAWHPNLKFVTDWSYLDSSHPELGVLKYFRYLDVFRKMLWSVHYRWAE